MFTMLVKDLYGSYKDLPLTLFQIQTKYRDEARPRAGLLRGREFIMKDSYTFDMDAEGLQRSYETHRGAYINVMDRLGLDYVIVKAMSGAMGGSASEEFLAIAPNGEDTFVRSPGGYAANVEAVTVVPPEPVDASQTPAPLVIHTPGAGTIDTLVTAVNETEPRADRAWTGMDTLKNVVFMLANPDGTKTPLIVGLPGDRDVDVKRLEAAVSPAEAVAFGDADFAANPALVKGYIGPAKDGRAMLGKESASGIRYLVDPRVVDGTAWVTGANLADHHVVNLVAGRDFTADGVIDVAEVRAGDPAPDGSGPLELARGVEMGHIFQLGTKYAEALGLKVLDANGKLATVTMGSYGIGISRAVAMVAETTCDERGLAWPRNLAPFDVIVIPAGKEEALAVEAERIARELSGSGLEVLLDDRKASPGVKFTDAEVLGIPTAVVVGRGLVNGIVELRDRTAGTKDEVGVDDVVARVIEDVRGE
jgi:prolyl-tRNA synthetase